jgi:hypothetical protein
MPKLAIDGVSLAEWAVQHGLPPWRVFGLVCAGRVRGWKQNGRWYLDREGAANLARDLEASAATAASSAPHAPGAA